MKHVVAITGHTAGDTGSLLDYLELLASLSRSGHIDDVYIELNESWDRIYDLAPSRFESSYSDFKFIKGVVQLDIPRSKNYFNEVARLKKSKRLSVLDAVSETYKKDDTYILFSRADTHLNEEIILQYVYRKLEPSDILKDKIWIPSSDAIKPFYINDIAFMCNLGDMHKMSSCKFYMHTHPYGIQHIREFIGLFLDKYPQMQEYLDNKEGFLLDLYPTPNGTRNEIKKLFQGDFVRSLVFDYHRILNRYFNIFGDRLQFADYTGNARASQFFNKDYLYNTAHTLSSNISKNTKYDGTLYLYENTDIQKQLCEELFRHRDRFKQFLRVLEEEKIRYVIIRGHAKLPLTPDTDLDIVCHREDYSKFLGIVSMFWDKNQNGAPFSEYIDNYYCEYSQWLTSGEEDLSIHNGRFTMDVYNHFFFHCGENKACLNMEFEDFIFESGRERNELGYYTTSPEIEILLYGYRNVFDRGGKFKKKHINAIKKLFTKNSSLKNEGAFSTVESLDSRAKDVLQEVLKNVQD